MRLLRVAVAAPGGGSGAARHHQDGHLQPLLHRGPGLALRPRGPGPPTPRHASGLQGGFPKVRSIKQMIDNGIYI